MCHRDQYATPLFCSHEVLVGKWFGSDHWQCCGKMIEPLDVKRSEDGSITGLEFNVDAGIYLGKEAFTQTQDTPFFLRSNTFGRPLIGSITISYLEADTGALMPSMVCKESGCEGTQPSGGAHTNNTSARRIF